MRISDWSSDVCSSDLARSSPSSWVGRATTCGASAPLRNTRKSEPKSGKPCMTTPCRQPEGTLMATSQAEAMAISPGATGRPGWHMPNWLATTLSILLAVGIWEYFGREANPLLGTYPSAVFAAFLDMVRDGRLLEAFLESSQPFAVGYLVAAIIGIPFGLLLGRYRILESTVGIYVTAGYATPLIALRSEEHTSELQSLMRISY